MLYGEILKSSMIDKKIDGKESDESKNIYNHYLDMRKKIMKITQFRVEDIFSDITSKDSISPERITKPNNSSVKILWV